MNETKVPRLPFPTTIFHLSQALISRAGHLGVLPVAFSLLSTRACYFVLVPAPQNVIDLSSLSQLAAVPAFLARPTPATCPSVTGKNRRTMWRQTGMATAWQNGTACSGVPAGLTTACHHRGAAATTLTPPATSAQTCERLLPTCLLPCHYGSVPHFPTTLSGRDMHFRGLDWKEHCLARGVVDARQNNTVADVRDTVPLVTVLGGLALAFCRRCLARVLRFCALPYHIRLPLPADACSLSVSSLYLYVLAGCKSSVPTFSMRQAFCLAPWWVCG